MQTTHVVDGDREGRERGAVSWYRLAVEHIISILQEHRKPQSDVQSRVESGLAIRAGLAEGRARVRKRALSRGVVLGLKLERDPIADLGGDVRRREGELAVGTDGDGVRCAGSG